MRDFAFEYTRSIPAGRVVFRARNVGRLQHELALVPLSEDFPPIDVQLHGSVRRTVDAIAGIHGRDPGQSGTFAVDLVAGHRYALLCFFEAPDGESHAVKGMASEFRAGVPLRKGRK